MSLASRNVEPNRSGAQDVASVNSTHRAPERRPRPDHCCDNPERDQYRPGRSGTARNHNGPTREPKQEHHQATSSAPNATARRKQPRPRSCHTTYEWSAAGREAQLCGHNLREDKHPESPWGWLQEEWQPRIGGARPLLAVWCSWRQNRVGRPCLAEGRLRCTILIASLSRIIVPVLGSSLSFVDLRYHLC